MDENLEDYPHLTDEQRCLDRGPRIGNEGALVCILPKGHEGQHKSHSSWRQAGWSQLHPSL